MFSKY